MKILKYGLFGILVGELVVLLNRDSKLQKHMKNKSSYEKVELATKELVAVNKETLSKIQKADFQSIIDGVVDFFNVQDTKVHDTISNIKSRTDNVDRTQVDKMIKSFEKSAKEAITKLQDSK